MRSQMKTSEDHDNNLDHLVQGDGEYGYDYEIDEDRTPLSDVDQESKLSDQEYQDRYERAKQRVEDIKGFYIHLAVYICIVGSLTILDLLGNGKFDFAQYVILGWGVAVVIHFGSVFGESLFLGRDWEERKIRELIYRDEKPKRRG